MTVINPVITTTLAGKASTIASAMMLLFSASTVAAASDDNEQQKIAAGKSIFAQYGIDDDLPKLGVSSLVQGEHLVEHVTRTVTYRDQVHQSTVYLVKNTDRKGNIDLRIKYDENALDEQEDLIEQIENATRTQYRLRHWAQSYDPTSVEAITDANGNVSVSFNYSKYGLPQDIAYFRFLSVKVDIVNGKPHKMVISNRRPFKLDGTNVEQYNQHISFDTLSNGKLIIDEKYIEMTGTKKGKPIKIVETVEPVAFYDDTAEVEIIDHQRLTEVSDPRFREEQVEVNRTFPLLGDMVRQQGIDLPLPFGLSMSYRNQDMSLPTNDFIIGGVRLNDFFDPNDTFADVTAEAMTLRGDINILPFWNMFGYIGKINVDANVDASYTGEAGQIIKDKLNDALPGVGDKFCEGVSVLCNKARLNVPLQLEYDLVGVGTTLSVGYKQFFASVTATYSMTRMEGNTDWGDGLITVQPMLGYQLADYRAQIFVGAEYQGLDNRMQGHVVAGDIEFDYDVGVDLNNWAYLVGFNKQFGKNYNLTVLYNKGETRNAFTLNFGYRF
ncbi:hypothetical protein FLM48_05555 [Shewanella sp. Scap07]|uniref:hypothetical protein n=1 Tax=Shewanella sp. Scap07 TaxID=2589987 RepID=UPI0015BA314E|nr:hypothetical protein [Shewanella sp. Scap07]QLE84604.1 hypothetical protein FLM48_05555 [Shewanella sp. Scap07]